MVVEPEIGGPIVAPTTEGWTDVFEQEIVPALPYRDVALAHLDAHHVVIHQCQDTSLIITKKRHDDAVEAV